MALEQYTNDASTTLNGAINNSVTSLTVNSIASFPTSGNFRIRIDNEIIKVTAVASFVFTVLRGQEGTTAAAHSNNAAVSHILTKEALKEIIKQESWKPYPIFTPGAYDDEFDDENFSGWTLVQAGAAVVTTTEINNLVSIVHPGGDSGGQLHAFMKSGTIAIGDYIEMCGRDFGPDQSFNIYGLIFADGITAGAGNQVIGYYSANESRLMMGAPTNYVGGSTTYYTVFAGLYRNGFIFLRLKYTAANTWSLFTSVDGINWINISTTTFSRTLTPTYMGFFVSTWNGVLPHIFSLEYFKKGP